MIIKNRSSTVVTTNTKDSKKEKALKLHNATEMDKLGCLIAKDGHTRTCVHLEDNWHLV